MSKIFLNLFWQILISLSPELHAGGKMADLAKFHQTKRKFMDLTILANFS